MHKIKLPTKHKESTCSSQDIALSWVPTYVDYTVPINYKPTKYELKMMVKSKKYVTGKRQEITIKNENEGMRKKYYPKKF